MIIYLYIRVKQGRPQFDQAGWGADLTICCWLTWCWPSEMIKHVLQFPNFVPFALNLWSLFPICPSSAFAHEFNCVSVLCILQTCSNRILFAFHLGFVCVLLLCRLRFLLVLAFRFCAFALVKPGCLDVIHEGTCIPVSHVLLVDIS